MIFDTVVQGVPCKCKVTHYSPYKPGKFTGPPEDCYPAETSEFSFQLLDETGSLRYDRLEACLTLEDEERLQTEYEAIVKEENDDRKVS